MARFPRLGPEKPGRQDGCRNQSPALPVGQRPIRIDVLDVPPHRTGLSILLEGLVRSLGIVDHWEEVLKHRQMLVFAEFIGRKSVEGQDDSGGPKTLSRLGELAV